MRLEDPWTSPATGRLTDSSGGMGTALLEKELGQRSTNRLIPASAGTSLRTVVLGLQLLSRGGHGDGNEDLLQLAASGISQGRETCNEYQRYWPCREGSLVWDMTC